MNEKIRILFLSANPWTTSRILVDEEAREVFEKLQEGPYRDKFELHKHAAIRPIDLQRFLMMYRPHIVHFSGHGSKSHKIILGGTPGRGKKVDQQGLVEIFALYQKHVRLAFLNACFTTTQARSLSEVIDYSVGAGKMIGDKGGVAFAGAFYRALSFGKSIKEAFQSAKAEIALTRMPRTRGFELFVRNGISENDAFPQAHGDVSSESAGPATLFSHLLPAQAVDQGVLHCIKSLPHDASVIERTEGSKIRTPVFETSVIEKLTQCEETRHLAEDVQWSIPSMRRETSAPAPASRSFADTRSAKTKLRKTKRLRIATPRPGKCEIERRSSRKFSRANFTMTVEAHRIALKVTTISLTQTVLDDHWVR